jgi:subtilisin family serine protease
MSRRAKDAMPTPSDPIHDNFETITGIGRGYAQALETVGIYSFADLAQYTPQTLAQALQTQAGVHVTARRIASEDWIGQGRRLAQQTPAAAVQPAQAADVGQQPQEIIVRKGDTMDEIELQRGGRKVTFKKLPDRFAMRLTQGRATSEGALAAALGTPETEVTYVDAVPPANMDIFVVDDPAKLEETVDRLRASTSADVVSHVYTLDDTPDGEVIPVGTLTIQFKPEVPKAQREAILAEFGLEVVEDLHFLPEGYTVRLTEAARENPLKIAAKLQQRPELITAEPDLSFKVSLQYAPRDDLYPQQWHLHNRGDLLGLMAGADVKAEAAWDITRGLREITICIIDDGFDLEHPEFSQPGKIVAPRDFGQNDFDPSPFFFDDNHGTACAGVALAEEDGAGVVGLAPGCALMPVRMAPRLTDDAVVSYFQYAVDQGADVISCSWLATSWDFPLSTKMAGIIHYAASQGRRNKKGCVILFAAGNDDRPLDGDKLGRRSYQGFALHPDVIGVGASNSKDVRAHYSNYGPELTLCAPSSGSGGRGIVTTDRRGIKGYTATDYRHDFGGTSSATPLAAGLAALILSVNPELTAAEVKRLMIETADKIDPQNGEYVNGHSRWYGHGRINAHRAVQRARELITGGNGDQVEQPDIDIQIPAVRLSAVSPTPDVPGRRLVAEVRFQLSGSDTAALAANRTTYEIEIVTIDTLSGAINPIASLQEKLRPQTFEYTQNLFLPVPVPGRYELHTHVHLALPSGAKRTDYRGPALRVVQ